MKIEIFDLERTQSLWENRVEYNLTETGIHPFTTKELLSQDAIDRLMSVRLGYGYTNGLPELRDAISAMYHGTDRDNVLITAGSIEANFVAMWTLLERGDELILMLPNYMQIWGVTRAFDIDVKPFYLKRELEWQPDLDELRNLMSPKTKMIAVCNPNNPTGAVLSREAMNQIVELASDAGVWLYADEIYRGAELAGEETSSFYGNYEKAIVAGGLSKAYALPGLRIGWLVGPKEVIADCWARRDYTTISTQVLSNHIAAAALQPKQRLEILARNRRILKDNLEVLQNWTGEHGTLFDFIPPRAGGMAFLRYDLDINSTELMTKLRDEQSTFVVAGDCFGMDRWIRIGIGSERDYLTEGLRRTSELLAQIV